MAVRLQMKLGVVAEHDRLPDSPDTLVVVEPSVGSVARSKGHLYLLVTSTDRAASAPRRRPGSPPRRSGTSTTTTSRPGSGSASRRRSRPPTSGSPTSATGSGCKATDGNGPIGIGVAVVRGNELYVATVGPAEAYLIRQARLSTLPDPHRERGLPSRRPRAGRLARRDLGRRLARPRLAERHRQARRRRAQGRDGDAPPAVGDGAPPPPVRGGRRLRQRRGDRLRGDRGRRRPHKSRTLVPVRPAEPLAGAPDRSPIPLADNVSGRRRASAPPAGSARTAAGGAVERARRPGPGPHAAAQAGLPAGHAARVAARDPAPGGARGPRPRRRGRRPRARRLCLRRPVDPGGDLARSTPARRRSTRRAADLAKVIGPGHRPGRPTTRTRRSSSSPTPTSSSTIAAGGERQPRRSSRRCGKQVEAGLDRLYGVVPVALDRRSSRSRRPRAPTRSTSSDDGPRARRRPVRPRPGDEVGLPDRPQDEEGRRSSSSRARRTRAGPSATPTLPRASAARTC